VTSYSRQDVMRILQIGPRQLQGWERAGLVSQQQSYSFQDLGQLRTLRSLREESVSAASIRHSIVAMKAVAGMANPLLEASLVRTGTRLAFRHHGAMVDPIRRQLLFDFERLEQVTPWDSPRLGANPGPCASRRPRIPAACTAAFSPPCRPRRRRKSSGPLRFTRRSWALDPGYAPAYINLGTLHFHLRQYERAEQLYRRATEADPGYVLAFLTWETSSTSCSASMSPSTPTAGRSSWPPAMPTPTTTWPWPTNARANAGRPASLAGLCPPGLHRSLGRPRAGTDSQAAPRRKAHHRLARAKLYAPTQGPRGARTGHPETMVP